MDHSKIAIPRFKVKNKMTIGLGQLPVTLMGIIAHSRVKILQFDEHKDMLIKQVESQHERWVGET
jgi:hypothetical protein